MTNTTTLAALETIDTTKLAAVTGGCAACGNPGGQCRLKQQQPGQQQGPQGQRQG